MYPNKKIPNLFTKTHISHLPEFVLERVFFHLPGKDLLVNCQLVCKYWRAVLENEAFWRKKCVKDKKLVRHQVRLLQSLDIFECKRFYFANMFQKNFLKNPCGNEMMNHWVFCFFFIL
jgi:hypothetical protein